MELLVVGCGLTGAVIAREMAEKGKNVLLLERRDPMWAEICMTLKTNMDIWFKNTVPIFFILQKNRFFEYVKKI